MSNIQDLNEEQIYDKLMIILIANEGTIFDQYKLYSKLVDKLNLTSAAVPSFIKYKYLIVLRRLMSKSDNIKLTKEKDVYYIVYNESSTSKQNTVSYESSWINRNGFNEYVIENKMKDQINYCDPETGNTILHEVLKDNDINSIKKLINDYNIDYNIKNKSNESPIECIKDINVATVIISDLNSRIINIENNLSIRIIELESKSIQLEGKNTQLEGKITQLETRNFIDEYSLTDIIKVKFNIYLQKNWIKLNIYLLIGIFVMLFINKFY